jgi:signal transduction histidine kinase
MLLEVFANRAAAELERMRVDEALASSHARLERVNVELERRVAERTAELEAALRATREALVLREDFIRAASHELSTPITSVQLSAHRLADRLDRLDARDRADVERLGRQIDRLRVLVAQMLEGIRLQSGRVSLKRGRVDLVELVRRVLDGLELDCARSGSTATIRSSEPVVGSWDGSRIEQLVTNLIANAIKYGRGEPIEVEVQATADGARLRVTDHGIGVAPAEHEQIFEPFHRAAPVHSYGGLGLGLYICGQIVRLHGGTIAVQSVEGQGATFTVELPWDEAS